MMEDGRARAHNGQAGPTEKPADRDEVEDGPSGSDLLSRLLGFWGKGKVDADFNEALEDGGSTSKSLPRSRREMIERVVAFDEKRVEDVMAPRADIVAVDVETPLDELVRIFAEAGHSRLPIYRGDLDNPLGVVHIRDVIALLAAAQTEKNSAAVIGRIRREVLYVPPSMRITDLLLRMQAARIHMALVIDEYGGTDGLVTIEDLVEEIVGDINDEHDEEEAPTIRARGPDEWEADARVELSDFTAQTGVEIVVEDEEIDTLGGLVFYLAGRVPHRGEVLPHPAGLDFEIVEGDPRKVRRLLIRRSEPPKDDAESEKAI